MKAHSFLAALLVATLAPAVVVAQAAPQVVIDGYTVNVSSSTSGSLAVKSNTEAFSGDIQAGGSLTISTRAVSSFVRQGRSVGTITITVGDNAPESYALGSGFTLTKEAFGNTRVQVVVTLTAFAGVGSASITLDDVVVLAN